MYDPQLGRWHTMDPLTEWDFKTSPYAYCANNPLRYTDPTGMDKNDRVIRRTKRRARRLQRKNPNSTVYYSILLKGGVAVGKVYINGPSKDGGVSTTMVSRLEGKVSKKKNRPRRYTNRVGIVIWGSGSDNSQSVAPYSTKDEIGSIELETLEWMMKSYFKKKNFKKPGGKEIYDDWGKLVKKALETSDVEILENHGGTGELTDSQGNRLVPVVIETDGSRNYPGGSYGSYPKIYKRGDTLIVADEKHFVPVDSGNDSTQCILWSNTSKFTRTPSNTLP